MQSKEEKLAKAREYDRKRYRANPEGKKAACKRYRTSDKGKQGTIKRRLSVYGLTPEDYATLLSSQGGKCAICLSEVSNKTQPWRLFYVDHDHTTCKVRGLLCCACNSWLGVIKDDPQAGARVTAYLKGGIE